jgi:hypothetical protein
MSRIETIAEGVTLYLGIKRIADRAEARRSAAVYTASATPSSRKSRKSSGARS